MFQELVQAVHEAGVGGLLQLGLLVLGLLWSLVVSVMVGLRWKVPAVVAVAPLIAHAVVAAVAASASASGMSHATSAIDPAMRATLLASGISGTINNGLLASVALPSGLVLTLGAVAAGVRAPRRFGAPIGALLLAGLCALLPLLSLVWHGPMPLAAGRVVLYGFAAVLTAAAFCGAHPRTNAREASVIAAASWTTLVAVGEMVTLGYGWAQGFRALAVVSLNQKAQILAALLDEMAPLQTLGMVTILASALPMLIAVFRPDIDLSDEEMPIGSLSRSPARAIGVFLAALTPLAWLIALWCASPAGGLASMIPLYESGR